MLKMISKFVLEVLPSALATLIGGILLSSYHYHFMMPRAPDAPKAIAEEVAAPPAAGANVVEGAHAAVVEVQQPASPAEQPKAQETKGPELKPPETKAHETKGAEAKALESKRQETKTAKPTAQRVRPTMATPRTHDATEANRIDQATPRVAPSTVAPVPPPVIATAPRPVDPAGALAPPAPAAPVAPPGAVATPGPVVPEPFSVTELNAKLAGRTRPAPGPQQPVPVTPAPPVRFGGPLDPIAATPRPAAPEDFAR